MFMLIPDSEAGALRSQPRTEGPEFNILFALSPARHSLMAKQNAFTTSNQVAGLQVQGLSGVDSVSLHNQI